MSTLALFLALLGVRFVTKVAAGYVSSKIARFSGKVILAIGFQMNGRGMVELVVPSKSFCLGIKDMTLFSIAVPLGLVTTILAPLTSHPMVSIVKSKGSNAVSVKDPWGKD